MGISGSQKAYTYAQGGVMRGSSSRANVHSPLVFVAIAGVQYASARAVDAQQVDNETLTITETDGDTPSTAAFSVRGFTPSDGQEIVITQGSINNLERLFAGLLLSDTTGYAGTPANLHDQANAIDYSWHLTRETITQRWTNVSATTIALAILAHAARGFTTRRVEAGLPIVDEFTVTNEPHFTALRRLADRIGGRVKPTYGKDVLFGFGGSLDTPPTVLTLTSANLVEMTDLAVTRDLSQVVTRQPVEGGGSQAFEPVAPGSTVLPVTDDAWYNPAGGMVVSGPQRITYTGIGFAYAPNFAWTAQEPASRIRWRGVAYAPTLNRFAAVATGGGGDWIMTSDNGGATWVLRTTPAFPGWNDVIWVPGLNLFVAVAISAATANVVMTSPDGITWTLRTAAASANQLAAVAWSPTLALLVAVGWSGTQRVQTSPDGITWTLRNASDNTVVWYGVAWAPALNLFAAVSFNSKAMTSPDGITWTTRTTPARQWQAVTWSPELALFVAVGTSGAVMTSPDGITWTDRTAAEANNWSRVVWTGALGLFVAVSTNGTNRVMTSADGITWIARPAPAGEWQGLTWADAIGTLVAVGDNLSSPSAWLMVSKSPAHPTLTGIPASGPGSILYAITQGDPVNLRVVVDDLPAQAAIAGLIGGGDDGIIEGAVIQDGRISETEARARGRAQLELHKNLDVAVSFTSRDRNVHASRTQSLNLTQPAVVGDFKIQSVTISNFHPSRWPTRQVSASSSRFTLEDLLRETRQAGTT